MTVCNNCHFFILGGVCLKKSFICYLLIFLLVFNSVSFVCFANDNPYVDVPAWDSLSNKDKIGYYLGYLTHNAGLVLSGKFSDAKLFADFFQQYKNGTIKKKVADMTEDEYEEYCGKMVDSVKDDIKVVQQGQKTQLHISADTNKSFKSFAKQVIDDLETPLYYTVHIPSIKQLYPSNVDYVYVYNQIKQIVDEFGLVQIFGFQPSYVRFYDIPDDLSDYFSILYSRNKYNSGDLNMYRISSYLYSCKTETYAKYDSYGINFDDDKTIISDIKNNYSSLTHDSFGVLYPNFLDVSQTIYGDTYRLSSNFMVAPDDLYIKVYTSLANYQNSLAGKVQRNVYYTSNYYNNTYNDSDVDMETLYKYMNNIQSILEKLKIEERENNYDEDALTRRLDALINAIWSSTGDISDDTGTLVEQNNKALKWYEKIYNKLCDIKGSLADDSISEPWNKEVTNLVKNTDNDATMNNFFTSLSLTFSPVGESMKTKFPFSMPWDVYAVIVLLCAEPQTPKYTLPFKFDTFGIDTELVVDCSHLSFLATVSRTMLTLLYILGLIRLTTKIIGKGDD